jgi:hypothetical protein
MSSCRDSPMLGREECTMPWVRCQTDTVPVCLAWASGPGLAAEDADGEVAMSVPLALAHGIRDLYRDLR